MRHADQIEFAIWLSGTESDEMLQRWKAVEARAFMEDEATLHNVEVGPITFVTKRPGEDRVPPVPDGIHGPDVRLLVAEAKVLAKKPHTVSRVSGFLLELTKDDLQKLREVTRKAHKLRHPGDHLSDYYCDVIIDQLGPDTAGALLRGGAVQ